MSCENANWIPIESNPEVINDYCKKLGLKSGAYFHDVFGLDEAPPLGLNRIRVAKKDDHPLPMVFQARSLQQ